MKRIAILALTRHITSLGGIGFYIDSFIHATRGHYIVDLIVDRPVKKSEIPFKHIADADIIFSQKNVPYSASSKFFMFYGEKAPYELGINVIQSFAEATKTRIYDCIFVNSHEMGVHVAHAGLHKVVPTVAYTHHNILYRGYPESLDEVGAMNLGLFELTHITQDPNFQMPFVKEQFFVPMFTSEYEMFLNTKPKPEKNTALFNGTFRDIKRPKDFLEFCKVHGKKGLIITNAKGKDFFEEEFAKAGLECEVRTSIFGQDKVDFISRAEMMFHPAECEMFSYAVLEALFFMPVHVYQENWVSMYDGLHIMKSIKDYSPKQFDPKQREWAIDYFEPKETIWQLDNVIDKLKSRLDAKSTSSSLHDVQEVVKSKNGISIASYWSQLKNRSDLILADIVTMYKIANSVDVTQTMHQSFFGKEVAEEQDSTNTLDDMF